MVWSESLGHLYQVAVITAYGAGTVLTLAGVITRRQGLRNAGMACALLGFIVHFLDLGHTTSQPGNSLTEGSFYFSLLAWAFILGWFVAWRVFKLGFLALTVSPLALLFYISSLAAHRLSVVIPKGLTPWFFGLHVGTLFLSLAVLGVAFGAGMTFLHLESKIKTKEKLSGFRLDLPSLATCDRVNYWAVMIGFPLYTLGLASGFVWARATWHKYVTWDPKEIVALGIWFIFAYLFHQRIVLGWRGRKPAIFAMWIFALAIGSMFFINLLLPGHHSFTAP